MKTNKPHHGIINNGVLTWVNEPEKDAAKEAALDFNESANSFWAIKKEVQGALYLETEPPKELNDKKMNKEEALKKMKSLNRDSGEDRDFESDHGQADDILCDFLKSLGHEDLVEAFGKVGKWYS